MKKISTKKAYTLIEIVVVISIMGLFTALIYSSFDKSKAKSRDQKRISDISAVQLSLEQYFSRNGVYPMKLQDLTIKPTPTSAPFLNEMPKNPLSSTNVNGDYIGYFPITRTQSSDKCTSYHLWVKFEQVNSYLDQKKGFDSSHLPQDATTKRSMYECGSSHHPVNASADKLIYDVVM